MEKEISISKDSLIEKFNRIAEIMKEKYDLNLWFVEILGKRWSYIAGLKEDNSFSPPECIQINERFGIVSNNWEKITSDEKERLLLSLRELI